MGELRWRKSTRSGSSVNCVEVARDVHTVWVRDSKDRAGVRVRVPEAGWCAFVSSLRTGRFDGC